MTNIRHYNKEHLLSTFFYPVKGLVHNLLFTTATHSPLRRKEEIFKRVTYIKYGKRWVTFPYVSTESKFCAGCIARLSNPSLHP